ncbi:MAG: hypothetical protein GX945_06485 [Lentisphaerae bacterium]|jgi:hypothetical protein|nr:hypothetical protein [Lentisphaerota bacterium]
MHSNKKNNTMRRMLHGVLSALSVLVFAGTFCGCLDHEQTVVFNKDDSVIVSYLYIFPENQRQTLENAQAVIDQWQGQSDPAGRVAGLNCFLNEEAVKRYFNARPDVELRHYKQTTENGFCRVQIIVLGRDAAKAINSGIFGAFQLKQENGLTSFSAELPSTPARWDQQRLAQLRSLLAGTQLRLSVNTPTPIRCCSHERHDTSSASWAFTAQPGPDRPDSADLLAPPPTMSVSW